jgi:hypothetical protein
VEYRATNVYFEVDEMKDEDWKIYQDLWARADAEDAFVHYDGRDLHGEGGWFHPRYDEDGTPNPVITIVRPYYREATTPHKERNNGAPVDLMKELITLAHEYGHFRSWRAETTRATWQAYLAAAIKRDATREASDASAPESEDGEARNRRRRAVVAETLTEEEKSLIVAEEKLAWKIGRATLVELGFTELGLYDARARHGVHCHRYRLGLDELWPEDEVSE